MADVTKEPWMDGAKNQVAQDKRMENTNVKPVMLVGVDGEPYNASGGGGGVVGKTPTSADSSSVTSVSASTSSVSLLSSNSNRIEAIIENNGTAILLVKYGTAASSGSYTVSLSPGEVLIVDTYSGVLHGIWDALGGEALVTETTN